MSERITGAELSALLLEIPANPERFYGSELVLGMAEELFDLRAEVERLRAVEAMVLALKRRNFSCPCEDCINRPDVRGEGECLYDKLSAALGEDKKEPTT